MIDIQHYVKKLKEHEQQRLSFNERMNYWKNYREINKETQFEDLPSHNVFDD